MLELPQRVVSNTTPIIALSVIGRLNLLRELYAEVMIPPAVFSEILAGGTSRTGVAELRRAGWIQTKSLQDPRRADLLVNLDRGEAEAIALAMEIDADLLLIDERLARRHALGLGLTITGSLGVLLKAKERGACSKAPTFDPGATPQQDSLERGCGRTGTATCRRDVTQMTSVYNFARFVQGGKSAPLPIAEDTEDWLKDSEEQMQAEDAV